MDSTPIVRALLEEMERWEIIDCHEHLPPERQRVEKGADVFTLFSHYTRHDLWSAGMSEAQYNALFDRTQPLEARWRQFAPFWERIRWTSYSRAALIAARRFYGVEDINADTYQVLSECIHAANTPGLYRRVLREACGIRSCLTQCGLTDLGSGDLLVPLMPLVWEQQMAQRATLLEPPFARGTTVQTLEQYLEAVEGYMVRVKAEGAVGLKWVVRPSGPPDREAARAVFEMVKRGQELPTSDWPDFPDLNPLTLYVADEAMRLATRHDLVIAVHTGYWGDFRKLNPSGLIPFLQRHPQARFDVYHLGYPYVREAIMLGKSFPNVWLNLCWTHIISQRFAMDAVDELIDTVPANKVLAFGGDYAEPVEKVYGHLVMAREDIARVLARRVAEGRMTEAAALGLARRWFWENPVALYRLPVGKGTGSG